MSCRLLEKEGPGFHLLQPCVLPESHRQQKTVTHSAAVKCVTVLWLQPSTPSGAAREALHLLRASQTELRGAEQKLSQKVLRSTHGQPLYAVPLQGTLTLSEALQTSQLAQLKCVP